MEVEFDAFTILIITKNSAKVPTLMATITKNRALEESGSRKRKRLGERESSISSQDELESDHLLTATEVDSLETSNYKPTDNLRPARKPKSVLSADKVSRSLTGVKNTGVIYISRIPPRLTPPKLRELLSPYGSKVLRIFLAPETTAEYTRRIKSGGSKMRQFKEGWVEFEDKKVAKNVVGILNAQRIGTKKGDFWYDDLWCLKYLPKFKWHHLTEQIGMYFSVVC